MLDGLQLHDGRDFPLVRFDPADIRDGYADAWCADMNRLLAGSERFALVYLESDRAESHEDRKKRGAWLKANKEALAGKCVALVIVEPDAEKRAEMEAMFPNLQRAFGTPQAARASQEEAEMLARDALACGALDEALTGL